MYSQTRAMCVHACATTEHEYLTGVIWGRHRASVCVRYPKQSRAHSHTHGLVAFHAHWRRGHTCTNVTPSQSKRSAPAIASGVLSGNLCRSSATRTRRTRFGKRPIRKACAVDDATRRYVTPSWPTRRERRLQDTKRNGERALTHLRALSTLCPERLRRLRINNRMIIFSMEYSPGH